MLNVALPIAAALTLFITASSPALACACCGTWQVYNVASDDVLNIRSGPSVHYGKVGYIPAGSACVIRTGPCQGSWCRISYASTTGWVNAKYLRYLD